MVTRAIGIASGRVVLAAAVLGAATVVLIGAGTALAAGRPTIELNGVSEVGERGATFEVTIDPDGAATSYGLHLTYGACQNMLPGQVGCGAISIQEITAGELPAGEGQQRLRFAVDALSPGYGYLYSVFARNAEGAAESAGLLLTAEPEAPKTGAIGPVGEESALLIGKIEPEDRGSPGFGSKVYVDFPRPWYFEYAPGSSCTGPESIKTTEESSIPGTYEVSAEVSGLQPATEYTACLVEVREGTPRAGSQSSFTTSSPPPPVSPSAGDTSEVPTPLAAVQVLTATVPASSVSAYAPQALAPSRPASAKAPSRLARALKTCARKPKRLRARCARRARRLYGAKRRHNRA